MSRYDWFRVSIKDNVDDGYTIVVTSFLGGDEISDVFTPPYSQVESELLLSRIENNLRKPMGHVKLKEIGEKLYKSIFSEAIEDYFGRCLEISKRGQGLRIELVIEPLHLRRLPWELMHDGREFLSLSTSTPIIRTIEQDVQRLPEVSYPLGILFMVADPVGARVPLNMGGEIRGVCKGISDSIGEGRIHLRCVRAGKLSDQSFTNDIKSGRYHVLHVSSHGVFAEGIEKGFLELEDGEGRPTLISIETLGTMIKDSSIQMVYLDACQTAIGSVRTPLADLSHIFLEKGVPAVLAMQFSVPEDSATTFCETFYAQLARQESIESALIEARKRTVHLIHGLDRIDWAIPALFISGYNVLSVDGELKTKRNYKLLPGLGIFVGREEHLNELTEDLIDPEVSVISVGGFGGIGKSTLIAKFVKDVGNLFTDVCWIDCESIISYDEIIEEINAMLIYHKIGFTQEELTKYTPIEKNRILAYVLEESSDDFILIFDNFDSIKDDENVRNLIQQISEGEKTKIFLTIRIPESIVKRQRFCRIDQLKEDEAILLMRKLAEQRGIEIIERADEVVLKQINERLDGHPMAIEVVIPLLAATPLKEVLQDLPQVLAGKIGAVLEWTLEKLTDEEKEFLFEISVFEGKIAYTALKAIHSSSSLPVAELVRKNLLSYDTERKLYNLHPLIRDFAYDKLDEETRKEIHRRAVAYFLSEEVSDPIKAIGHMYKAEDWKEGIYLTSEILDQLILHGFWAEAKKLCEDGLIAGQKIDDEKIQSVFKFELGNVLHRFGEYSEAEKLYKQTLETFKRLGDQSGIAKSLHQLAMIQQDRGNYDEAEKLYKQTLETFKRLGDQSDIAKSLHQLATIQKDRGNYDEAEKLYKQIFETFKRLGDQSGIVKSLHQLAMIQQGRGNYDEAEKLYKQSLEIKERLGDQPGIAKSLHQLAMIQQGRGNYDEAEKLYKQSLEINERLGDQSSTANSLGQLATIQKDRGNYDEAEKLYKQILETFKRLGDQSGIVKSLHQLATIQQGRGNYDEAEKLYKQSLEIKERLGDQSGIATSLHQLATIQQDRGNYDEAEKLYKQSLEIKERLGDQSGIAITYGALGRLYEQCEDNTKAVVYYDKALEIFKKIGQKQWELLAKTDIERVKSKISKKG